MTRWLRRSFDGERRKYREEMVRGMKFNRPLEDVVIDRSRNESIMPQTVGHQDRDHFKVALRGSPTNAQK